MEEKEQKTPKELITPRELTVLPEELTEEEDEAAIEALTKLWGIGLKIAQKLIDAGITTIEQVADMDVKEVAKNISARSDYLTIAQAVAKNITSAFVKSVTSNTFRITVKIWGVGLDFGLLLYAFGVKDITDVTPGLVIKFPALQNYLSNLLEIVKSQVQLALIVGLTSRDARKLVVDAEVTSLAELAKATPSKIRRALLKNRWIRSNISKNQAKIWIDLAAKLVQADILTYKKAAELPLARYIKGIGPEIGAVLYVLGMKSLEDFVKNMNAVIRNKYFPWVKDTEMKNWLNQALEVQQKVHNLPAIAYPFGMKSDEFWVAVFNPLEAVLVQRCREKATKIAEELFPYEPSDKTVRNAYLHAYWNCCMVFSFSESKKLWIFLDPDERLAKAEELAKMFADAHENYPGNPEDNKEMDLFNNQVGRDLAVRPNEVFIGRRWYGLCEQRVLKALYFGLLKYLDPPKDETIIPEDYLFKITY